MRAALLVGLLISGLVRDGAAERKPRGSGSGSDATAATTSDDDDEVPAGSGSALVAPPDPTARLGWLQARFTSAIAARPMLAKAKLAYHVIDLATGKELASHEADRAMNLASNAKLLTSVAALAGLGGGFRWRTAVFCAPPDDTGTVAGDLYIRGRGDPVLTVDGLRALAQEVAARGVRNVEGRLVIDATYFDTQTEPPHFDEQPKETSYFRAPVASFTVNRSMYTVVVMPEPGEAPARVTIEPPLPDYIKLTKTEVTSEAKGKTRLRIERKPKPGDQTIELELSGVIKVGDGTWDFRRRVDNPGRFAGEVFRRALVEQGIKFKQRSIGYATVPVAMTKPIAIHDSPTLADVLRSQNKHSDNNVAEAVMKTLGAELKTTPGPATWADGIAALRSQLAKLGVTGVYKIENGSGLFSATEVPAKQLVALLALAHKDYRIGPDLVASLPVGGHDGTLAKRWHGHPAAGRVRAKTGTLDRVSTLAGYVGVDSAHQLAFAILANDIPAGQRGVVRAMADEMVDSLAAYLDAR